MKPTTKKIFFGEYSSPEWFCMKISLMFVWLGVTIPILLKYTSTNYPVGICQLFDCSIFLQNWSKYILLFLILAASTSYLFEYKMKLFTPIIFFISVLLCTIQESNTVRNWMGVLSMVLFAQSIAYWRNSFNLNQERVQFSVQVTAAGYTLAAISKLQASGLQWIWDAPRFSLQIMKIHHWIYLDFGNTLEIAKGENLSNWIIFHASFISFLFGATLVIEFFAFIAMINKKCAFYYGILLFSMHLGIFVFMDLVGSVFLFAVIFMLNPLFGIYNIIKKATYDPFQNLIKRNIF